MNIEYPYINSMRRIGMRNKLSVLVAIIMLLAAVMGFSSIAFAEGEETPDTPVVENNDTPANEPAIVDDRGQDRITTTAAPTTVATTQTPTATTRAPQTRTTAPATNASKDDIPDKVTQDNDDVVTLAKNETAFYDEDDVETAKKVTTTKRATTTKKRYTQSNYNYNRTTTVTTTEETTTEETTTETTTPVYSETSAITFYTPTYTEAVEESSGVKPSVIFCITGGIIVLLIVAFAVVIIMKKKKK